MVAGGTGAKQGDADHIREHRRERVVGGEIGEADEGRKRRRRDEEHDDASAASRRSGVARQDRQQSRALERRGLFDEACRADRQSRSAAFLVVGRSDRPATIAAVVTAMRRL